MLRDVAMQEEPHAAGHAATDSDRAVEEARRILSTVSDGGLTVRLLGGAAIALRCQHARPPAPLARRYSDLDLVVDRRSATGLEKVLVDLGYRADVEFNTLHGRLRLVFDHADHSHLDVFVERFVMCHELNLGARLQVDTQTIPLADLWLTKLQVAKITHKDVVDVAALLVDWAVSDDDSGVNRRYIADLLSRDWGWWRTVTENVTIVRGRLAELGLGEAEQVLVTTRLDEIVADVERAPKTLRWKARARLGDRVPWREDPEESRDE
jgi:Uncharacterised nucleotidyltransferase